MFVIANKVALANKVFKIQSGIVEVAGGVNYIDLISEFEALSLTVAEFEANTETIAQFEAGTLTELDLAS